MATKLRSVSHHWLSKTIAALLVAVTFGCFVTLGAELLLRVNDGVYDGAIFQKDYVSEDPVMRQLYANIQSILQMKSEEYVASGDYWFGVGRAAVTVPEAAETAPEYEEWQREYQSEIARQLFTFHNVRDALEKTEGLYYYAAIGDLVWTNCAMTTTDEFKALKYYHLIDGYEEEFSYESLYNYEWSPRVWNGGLSASGGIVGQKIFIAYDDAFVAEKQTEFATEKAVLYGMLRRLAVIFLLGLVLLSYLIAVSGRDKNGELKMRAIDQLWTEFSAVFLLVVAIAAAGVFVEGINWVTQPYAASRSAELRQWLWLISTCYALLCALGLAFLLSLVRHIKNRTLVKHSLIYTIGRAIFAYTPLKMKIFGVVLLAELVAVTAGVGLYRGDASLPFLLLLFLGTAGVFYLVAKHVLKPYDEEVNSRLKTSLERAMKAERLKTELITNVSHDLKTPLTAILNYSDLLLKEGEDNEYAQIIHEKSQKLKSLTEDLFEVSKAQSGNLQVNSEKLDVAELIRQTLAEFDELQLPFKIRLEEGCCILADGKLMSRVFENIIGNIVKYSLENTRAYIDSAAQDGEINITFKNIANYEMNFEAADMAERFARGDEARTTDGNGLGLAIAKSYTEACGGRLEVAFDGDLFKVSLWFKAPDAPVIW